MLDYTYDINVESAYIIRIDGNDISERMAERCAESCRKIGQPYQFFKAVKGTANNLVFPENTHQIIHLLKLTNTSLTITEIACIMSHFLLWVRCLEIDKPIVILEHDSIMLQPYLVHPYFNIIGYLGSSEQVLDGWKSNFSIPLHLQFNANYRYIGRAHAYAVDPMAARQLVAKIIKTGIIAPTDIFIRIDEFGIIQNGIYAYNHSEETTIEHSGLLSAQLV